MSACLNAAEAVAGPLRAKAKRCWAPRASITFNHLEVALRPVPAAHVAAINPNYDGAGRRRCGELRILGGVLPHNVLADPQRPVPDRAGVLRPADRQQLGQKGRDLAEGRQGRELGSHIGQFRGKTRAQVEGGEALRFARAVAGADEQPSDPDRHVAEQGAERRGVIALAGQRTFTRRTAALPLAYDGQLPRNHLGLERRRELLGFVEPQPEVGQARLLATLNARDLGLGRHAGLQLRHQLHTPYQLRHQPTLFP
jgi:hypothetical protein